MSKQREESPDIRLFEVDMARIASFKPQNRQIQGITQANPCVITTTSEHGYVSGLVVDFFFPLPSFGMQQLTQRSYQITVLSSSNFSIDEDSRGFTAFNTAITDQTAQVVPVAETNVDFANVYRNITT